MELRWGRRRDREIWRNSLADKENNRGKGPEAGTLVFAGAAVTD